MKFILDLDKLAFKQKEFPNLKALKDYETEKWQTEEHILVIHFIDEETETIHFLEREV